MLMYRQPEVPKADMLYLLAQALAVRTPGFFNIKGAGDGDRATAVFISQLRKLAKGRFGADHSEARACKTAGFAFDFYFRDDETVVEIALGLRNPNSEFERDILKCLLALDNGCGVKRLLFIAKPGALAQQSSPGRKAIADYARRRFGLEIEVLELEPAGVSCLADPAGRIE